MTIPRQLGPETGPRRILPDFSRSDATVERMIESLDGPSGRTAHRGPVRVLVPAASMMDTAIRATISAALLGVALVLVVLVLVLLFSVDDGHAPGIGMVLVLLLLGTLALVFVLLAARFAVVALGTARGRVEITEQELRVVGGLRTRDVPWRDVLAIESRVIHPIHGLTAALRLRDGTRVVMPAFDRHIWSYSAPSGQDVRKLRRMLHDREQATYRPR